ncbi:MAG: hypothetical protein ACM3X6_02440 [Patescibacteria group bacterium]
MKYLLCMVLALALVFSVAAVSMATPVMGTGEGQFILFGDWDGWEDGFVAGFGYGITDGLTLGAMYDVSYGVFGAFANLALSPIVVQADVWVDSYIYGTATGLWTFALDPLTLGLGAGLDFGPWGSDFFVSAAANMAAGDNLAIYGSVGYYPDGGWTWYKAGVSFAF